MSERIYRWTKRLLRQQLAVIRGELPPSIVLKNATYLNSARRKWLNGNIWIFQDRVVYVGEQMPNKLKDTEIVLFIWLEEEGSCKVIEKGITFTDQGIFHSF